MPWEAAWAFRARIGARGAPHWHGFSTNISHRETQGARLSLSEEPAHAAPPPTDGRDDVGWSFELRELTLPPCRLGLP